MFLVQHCSLALLNCLQYFTQFSSTSLSRRFNWFSYAVRFFPKIIPDFYVLSPNLNNLQECRVSLMGIFSILLFVSYVDSRLFRTGSFDDSNLHLPLDQISLGST